MQSHLITNANILKLADMVNTNLSKYIVALDAIEESKKIGGWCNPDGGMSESEMMQQIDVLFVEGAPSTLNDDNDYFDGSYIITPDTDNKLKMILGPYPSNSPGLVTVEEAYDIIVKMGKSNNLPI